MNFKTLNRCYNDIKTNLALLDTCNEHMATSVFPATARGNKNIGTVNIKMYLR